MTETNTHTFYNSRKHDLVSCGIRFRARAETTVRADRFEQLCEKPMFTQWLAMGWLQARPPQENAS